MPFWRNNSSGNLCFAACGYKGKNKPAYGVCRQVIDRVLMIFLAVWPGIR
ncbi:hypothetical protein EIKCOROL_00027 [Eikenella corrodens ATCC 23834]|uniref:Uncharacterized protein n=1 Tax=Eikenella corrodens ATCC 23834 TaxID=546274 RepID=C0DRR1_EIKCO|nr:hypothetical protein EIKCOROL_00027 [Eikenella corrodens ATCC 23834]